MNKDQNTKKGVPIKCDCGKILGYFIDGKIIVKCRGCKHEVDINRKIEPRAD